MAARRHGESQRTGTRHCSTPWSPTRSPRSSRIFRRWRKQLCNAFRIAGDPVTASTQRRCAITSSSIRSNAGAEPGSAPTGVRTTLSVGAAEDHGGWRKTANHRSGRTTQSEDLAIVLTEWINIGSNLGRRQTRIVHPCLVVRFAADFYIMENPGRRALDRCTGLVKYEQWADHVPFTIG